LTTAETPVPSDASVVIGESKKSRNVKKLELFVAFIVNGSVDVEPVFSTVIGIVCVLLSDTLYVIFVWLNPICANSAIVASRLKLIDVTTPLRFV